jgi:hypothetical protein
MGHMASTRDFYEDDEPVEAVIAAFERGTKVLTKPSTGPVWYETRYLRIPGLNVASPRMPLGTTEATQRRR